jgi:hypothetical protein
MTRRKSQVFFNTNIGRDQDFCSFDCFANSEIKCGFTAVLTKLESYPGFLQTQPVMADKPIHNFAYLAGGKIRLKTGSDAPRTLNSRFAETIRERALKAQQRHAWKGDGGGGGFMSGQVLWGRASQDTGAIPISITSICRGSAEGQLLYSLETGSMCGVLALDNLGAEERRLWNNNKQMLTRLSVNRGGDIVGSVEHKFGTANIGVKLAEEGAGFSEVTEGDSLDTAPRWVPGEKREIVFQSAGVGRNQHGHIAELAPFAIQRIDVDSGEMTVLLEDRRFDFLTPAQLADGSLFFIRRPYQTGPRVGPLEFIKDVFLFPFRLLYAVFQFLNFFSQIFTGKKLSRAGNAPQKEMDIKQMMIWGKIVQSQKNRPHEEEAPDLVQKSWELVRRHSNGDETVTARGVLAFDLADNGEIIYTNGSAVFRLGSDGKSEKVLADKMISQIAFVGF